jgi:hypothetical protein
MQWTTPLWAETAGTSHSEDEEVSTSSAPLTKTYGGDGMRLYDQVILREATEAQTSAWPTNRPTKKETECAMHAKPEGVGLESPLGYKTQREARYRRPPTRQVGPSTKAASPNKICLIKFLCCLAHYATYAVSATNDGCRRPILPCQ